MTMIKASTLKCGTVVAIFATSFLGTIQAATECGTPQPLTPTYLSGLINSENGLSNFIPSAYWQGGATKYVSTTETTIDDGELCVDGHSTAEVILLYDDGTNGDDVANDGVFSRACVHFCESVVDLTDIWNFAFERSIADARLIVVDRNLEGAIPSVSLPTPLYPGANVLATSHATFFVDEERTFFPSWPNSIGENGAAPNGKSMAVSSILSVFGDMFDYITMTGFESNFGIQGAGIYKYQVWAQAGGPSPGEAAGDAERCMLSMTGVPMYRMIGLIGNENTVTESGSQIHELVHGECGFEYHNNLDSAREGDGQHVPGSCTIDHSTLQGPLWDWTKGAFFSVPMSYCDVEEEEFCYPFDGDIVRLEANDDCSLCPDNQLTDCCTFRYEDALQIPSAMMEKRNLNAMSPLMQYIAGLRTLEYMEGLDSKDRTYYCMGSDTDGGCGSDPEDPDPERPACVNTVDDSDRNRVSSSFVSRYTFEDLVAANGGPRDPPLRVVPDLRHAALYIGQRVPTEAEMTFYTMLWRHHEVERTPHARSVSADGRRRSPIQTWLYSTSNLATLHSRLHGIDCGGGLQVPSCASGQQLCEEPLCGENADCIVLDGLPLCTCKDGLVGDGNTCITPEETVMYPLPSAHSLFAEAESQESCFGNNWPELVPEDSLPAYPGGVAPFKILTCEDVTCEAGDGPCELGVCINSSTPSTDVPSPTEAPFAATAPPTDITSPTAAPIAASVPTQTPTEAPSSGPKPACFSETNTVVSEDRGIISIKDVRIGDSVLTDNNKFETVYSLGHFSPSTEAIFLSIVTVAQASALEITSDHMVIANAGRALAARYLKVGDFIRLPNGESTEVLSISSTKSTGLFAPFTPSGKLVVNGVVVSSFVDVHSPVVSSQWLSISLERPHRLICSHFLDWCRESEMYTEDGLSYWVYFPATMATWIAQQHVVVRFLLFAVVAFALSFVRVACCIFEAECAVIVGLVLVWHLKIKRRFSGHSSMKKQQ